MDISNKVTDLLSIQVLPHPQDPTLPSKTHTRTGVHVCGHTCMHAQGLNNSYAPVTKIEIE